MFSSAEQIPETLPDCSIRLALMAPRAHPDAWIAHLQNQPQIAILGFGVAFKLLVEHREGLHQTRDILLRTDGAGIQNERIGDRNWSKTWFSAEPDRGTSEKAESGAL